MSAECSIKSGQQNIFFTEVRSTAVCLICQETLAVFKEYNINRHFATKHSNYASKQFPQERAATAQILTANLQTQQIFFTEKQRFKSQVLRQVFLLAFKLAKASKPFSEGEF